MSKNKKGKVVSLNAGKLSAENYIKTQARSLPVVECVINKGWEKAGICNIIIIIRGHKTGNLTVGLYLIDMYCLGLKDTGYKFNITPAELKYYRRNDPEMEDCSYVTVHNIIYGAIAYAEDYGFKPHKGFAVSQFILEDDDDDEVELIEFDFGYEGLPLYMPGPSNTEGKIKSIQATLERTAGPGNYSIIYPDDLADNEDDDDEDGDDFDEEDDDELEFDEDAIMDAMEKVKAEFVPILKRVNKAYDEYIRTPKAKEILENHPLGAKYQISPDPVDTEFVQFDNKGQENYYNDVYKMVFYDYELDGAIKELQQAVKRYPDKPVFSNLLQCAYTMDEQYDRSDDIVFEMYGRFPDYLFAKVAYANMLMDIDQYDAVLSIFNGKPDLHSLYPERNVFHMTEATAYYSTMCRYFIGVDNIDSADLYMNAILKNDLADMPGQTLMDTVVMQMIKVKMKILEEAGKDGLG